MIQQINLYQPMFRHERRVFSAKAMLACAGIMILGLSLLYGYGRWQVGLLADEVAGLNTQADAARQTLAGLDKRLPKRGKSKLLLTELGRLGKELGEKRRVVAAISEGAVGQRRGFSAYFEGLARQRVEGLWLRNIEISQGGKALSLRGSALRPELVPVLVERLSREAVFAGLQFHTLELERAPGDSAVFDFRLSTVKAEG